MIDPLSIQEGVTFGGLKDFDLTNIAKLLFMEVERKEFTLKVTKDDDYHIPTLK